MSQISMFQESVAAEWTEAIEAPVRAVFEEAQAEYNQNFLEPEQIAWNSIVKVLTNTRPEFYLGKSRSVSVGRKIPPYSWSKHHSDRDEYTSAFSPIVARWLFKTVREEGTDFVTYNMTVEALRDNRTDEHTNPMTLMRARENAARRAADPHKHWKLSKEPIYGVEPQREGRIKRHYWVNLDTVADRLVDWMQPWSEIWAKVSASSSQNGSTIGKFLAAQRENQYADIQEFVAPEHRTDARPPQYEELVKWVRKEWSYYSDQEHHFIDIDSPRPELTVAEAERLVEIKQAGIDAAYMPRQRLYHQDILTLAGLLEDAVPDFPGAELERAKNL